VLAWKYRAEIRTALRALKRQHATAQDLNRFLVAEPARGEETLEEGHARSDQSGNSERLTHAAIIVVAITPAATNTATRTTSPVRCAA
jgi:hypothetical protein